MLSHGAFSPESKTLFERQTVNTAATDTLRREMQDMDSFRNITGKN